MSSLSRRAFLGAAGRLAIGAALGSLAIEGCRRTPPRASLTIQAPPSPPSLAFLRMAQQGVPAGLAGELKFALWSTPDEMRARITSGQAQFSGLPINVAATLYNKGIQVQLLDVYIWNILYLVSSDPNVKSLADLKGQEVLIPLRGDLPDIMTQYICSKQGLRLGDDIKVSYLSAAPEAAQLLAAGKAKHAVLSEPSATTALLKAQQNGSRLYRVLDYGQLWAAATGKAARFPMAGVAALPAVAGDRKLMAWFQGAHREAVAWLAEHAEEAVQSGAEEIKAIPAAAMLGSLPYIKSEYVAADQARSEVQFFLQEISSISPDLIGGKLPADGFYYHA